MSNTNDDTEDARGHTMIDTSALEDEASAEEVTRISEGASLDDEPGKTIMFRSPFEESTPPARFIATFGNDRGREFLIPEGTVVVGRSLECGIVLNDPAVSRKHFEVRCEGGQYILKDLGSGNGTRIGGQRVTEIVLQDGMQIELGQTLLVFSTDSERTKVIPTLEAPAAPRPQVEEVRVKPSPRIEVAVSERRFPVLPVVVGCGGVVVIGLIVLHFVLGIRVFPFGADSSAPQPQAVVATNEAAEIYERGVKAIQAKDWDTAIRLIEQAIDKDPSLSGAEATLAMAREEKRNYSLLAAARVSLEKGNSVEAASMLTRVKDTSAYYPDAKKMLEQIEEAVVDREIDRIRALLASKKKQDARAAYIALLESHPENQRVIAFYDELAKAGVALERPIPRPVVQQEPESPPETKVATAPPPTKSVSPKGGKLDIARVMQLYNGGAFDQAIQELNTAAERLKGDDAEKARDLASRIARFASAYLDGKEALASKRLDKAEQGLILALRADHEINGHYDAEIRSLLGDTYRARAAAAMQDTRYVVAAKNAKRALSYKPDDALAKGILDKCIAVAQGLLDAASSDLKAGRKEAARQKLKDVLEIVPSTHELADKATELMQQTR